MLAQGCGECACVHRFAILVLKWYAHLFKLSKRFCAIAEIETTVDGVLAYPLLNAVCEFFAVVLSFKVIVPVVPATYREYNLTAILLLVIIPFIKLLVKLLDVILDSPFKRDGDCLC